MKNSINTLGLDEKEVVQQQNIQRARATCGFVEGLDNGIKLEMVSIPGGSFIMGSPEDEPENRRGEKPQHEVTVPSYHLGKYPITQAQWRAVVSNIPKVVQELDPDPSRFKGDNLPVENVSWFDAVEFTARLSKHTGREYRLPSEAEWEYACRAGTTTPFHFGETITTELANYDGYYTYNNEPQGEYRRRTTEVGSFPANSFGLYDMHGNVLEWCLDDMHSSYEGAPTNGSAWLDETQAITSKQSKAKVLRGGSWLSNPILCRSAYRFYESPASDIDDTGFRVMCAAL